MDSISNRGFTIIELVVVTAIIGFIMSVVFTGQNTFNKTILLKNTAYDVALTIRGAQTYGLSSTARGTAINVGYGVRFDRGRNSFILFADTSGSGCHTWASPSSPDYQIGNCSYDSGEKVVEYKIGNGLTVSDLCVNGSCGYSALNVVFARPNTETFINGSTGNSSCCIKISSQQGDLSGVRVTSVGQIVANTTCP